MSLVVRALREASAEDHGPEIIEAMIANFSPEYHRMLLEHGAQGYDRGALDDDYRLSVLGLIMRPIWQALSDLPAVIWWNNLERILFGDR